jgi:hypothetical protein
MAKIWPVYDGDEPTRGSPWASLPLKEVITLFDLKPESFVSDLEHTPRFGSRDIHWYHGFKHIVVEIGGTEAQKEQWKPGFYRLTAHPKDVFAKLVQRSISGALGAETVVRVEVEPIVDSSGHDALKVIVVIEPDAVRKVAGNAALNALFELKQKLYEMCEVRTPTIEYVTEEELAQDANP